MIQPVLREGGDIAIGDALVIADDVVVTVTDIDRNDGHILLLQVEGWAVSVGVGIKQAVPVIPAVAYSLSIEVTTFPRPEAR